jgi:hypothetical protein
MYRRVVTHYDRCAILFIVDCSLSMRNLTRFGTTEMSKIEVASLIVNHMIDDLVARATRGINVRDYYDIGVIGYSGYEAYSMLPGDDTVFKRVVRLVEDSPQPKYVYLNCQSVDGDIRSMPLLRSILQRVTSQHTKLSTSTSSTISEGRNLKIDTVTLT